ncbi:hypothetical protein F2Q69_00006299 [Brassica cretica]|uniref:Uncharacterized protein n=1 Tax=Brassica cretica TaxID=69181 RepID=A0A8S9P899_BRACR|nr:hypothetical protein F2Q69_00006299 [Brassica cretica]
MYCGFWLLPTAANDGDEVDMVRRAVAPTTSSDGSAGKARSKTGPIPRRWRDCQSQERGERERADFRREKDDHKA